MTNKITVVVINLTTKDVQVRDLAKDTAIDKHRPWVYTDSNNTIYDPIWYNEDRTITVVCSRPERK